MWENESNCKYSHTFLIHYHAGIVVFSFKNEQTENKIRKLKKHKSIFVALKKEVDAAKRIRKKEFGRKIYY